MTAFIIDASYLVAAFLFIYGLKRMSSPVTARSGIVVAGFGMVIAVLASFLYALDVREAARPLLTTNVTLALVALALGAGWAWWSGKRVAMTAMPQMVALYNGMGGGAAAAIAAVELLGGATHSAFVASLAAIGGLIGAVSLAGSLIAWAKLSGYINGTLRLPGLQLINGTLLLALLVLAALVVVHPEGLPVSPQVLLGAFFALALVYGVMMTMPIGGADMPVVISLYNAFTGLAVGFEGYVLNNPALMIAGLVVGSAGTLLTLLMARAMNRSVSNVLFSNFGAAAGADQGEVKGTMKAADASDAAVAMRYAGKVIIAPGYGLAVAQAQHKLYEFVKLLQEADVEVKFAIHPVAGRMPGHMNVLLAEANVPYPSLKEMEDANSEFPRTDVSLVIGANDVVNPDARNNPGSPIYGMPILNVDESKAVVVLKRSMSPGFAGIDNPLFVEPNTMMLFGDAKDSVSKLTAAVKSL
jgi:proton-translocating NAD(P)+ transhydrogenase subunit beta